MITVQDGEDTFTYSNISSRKQKTHTIFCVVFLDGEPDGMFYGNDSGKMREDLDRLYNDGYGRSPDYIEFGVMLDG